MFIYSKKIIRFINEIKFTVKEILTKELNLKVQSNFFLDREQTTYYPIAVVIYNDKSTLGYFDPMFNELGFHERLMHVSTRQLHNVIRHELAHYITFINYGDQAQPHGPEFRAFCERVGWGEEVYRATLCLESELNPSSIEDSDLFRKVQKLLALATSSNKHEAEQAMIKSQQLLLKHNIDSKYMGANDEEKVVLKRLLKQKKKDTKMRAIATILQTFFVTPVFRKTKNFTYLEISGSIVNIQIAEYVANVLQEKLDTLWAQTKKEHELKGIIAKNSFFLGLAKGYYDKINSLKKSYQTDVSYPLMAIEKKLTEETNMIYPRLLSSKSQGSYCSESGKLGEQAGRQLNINPGVEKASKNSEAFLTYNK